MKTIVVICAVMILCSSLAQFNPYTKHNPERFANKYLIDKETSNALFDSQNPYQELLFDFKHNIDLFVDNDESGGYVKIRDVSRAAQIALSHYKKEHKFDIKTAREFYYFVYVQTREMYSEYILDLVYKLYLQDADTSRGQSGMRDWLMFLSVIYPIANERAEIVYPFFPFDRGPINMAFSVKWSGSDKYFLHEAFLKTALLLGPLKDNRGNVYYSPVMADVKSGKYESLLFERETGLDMSIEYHAYKDMIPSAIVYKRLSDRGCHKDEIERRIQKSLDTPGFLFEHLHQFYGKLLFRFGIAIRSRVKDYENGKNRTEYEIANSIMLATLKVFRREYSLTNGIDFCDLLKNESCRNEIVNESCKVLRKSGDFAFADDEAIKSIVGYFIDNVNKKRPMDEEIDWILAVNNGFKDRKRPLLAMLREIRDKLDTPINTKKFIDRFIKSHGR